MSIKELIGVSDEILEYIHNDDLLGVPPLLFERFFSKTLIISLTEVVLSTERKWAVFEDLVKQRQTHPKTNKLPYPFSPQERDILTRCHLWYLLCSFRTPVRKSEAKTSTVSAAQKLFVQIPYRKDLYMMLKQDKSISKKVKNFLDASMEIKGKFLGSLTTAMETDRATYLDFSEVMREMIENSHAQCFIVLRFNRWNGSSKAIIIRLEVDVDEIMRSIFIKPIVSLMGYLREMGVLNRKSSSSENVSFREKTMIMPTRIIPDFMILSNDETIISVTESNNIDMSTFVQKVQLGEEPPELTEKVLKQVQSYAFLSTFPVYVFDGITILKVEVNVRDLCLTVPELTTNILCQRNTPLSTKITKNIKFNITPFEVDKGGITIQAQLASDWFQELSTADREILEDASPKEKLKDLLRKVSDALYLSYIDLCRSPSPIQEIYLQGNLSFANGARIEELSPIISRHAMDLHRQRNLVFTDVNVQKLAEIFEIRNYELMKAAKRSHCVLKILNSVFKDEDAEEDAFLIAYQNELKCYQRFQTVKEKGFKFTRLVSHGSIVITGEKKYYFIDGKYFIFEKLDNVDLSLADSAMKQRIMEETYKQVELLVTKFKILHRDLRLENLVISSVDPEVSVTIIDYGHVQFIDDYEGNKVDLDILVESYLRRAKEQIFHGMFLF